MITDTSRRLPCCHMPDAPARFKDLCLDALDHQALADWWCAVPGYVRRDSLDPADDDPRPAEWPIPIVDPAGAGPLLWIVPVPEPKTTKKRMQDDEIEWDVLADPEGNEFCVFFPE